MKESKRLDAICKNLNVATVSSFFDGNAAGIDFLDEEDLPDDPEEWVKSREAWFDPSELLAMLEALLSRFKAMNSQQRADLEVIKDIEWVMPMVRDAIGSGVKVHLRVMT